MILSSVKELAEIIEICRKNGVETIKVADLELKLSVDPGLIPSSSPVPAGLSQDYRPKMSVPVVNHSVLEPDRPSDEELLMWSVQEHADSPIKQEL